MVFKQAKEIVKKAWDAVPTKEEVADTIENTKEQAKEVAEKAWDAVPTKEEVAATVKNTKEQAKEVAEKAWDAVPTKEEIKNLWGSVPTVDEVQSLVDRMWDGVPTKEDSIEFAKLLGKLALKYGSKCINYKIDQAKEYGELINRLLKHNPHVAALIFDKVEGKTFDEAFEKARRAGLKTFIWPETGKVYSTKYEGSPEEQMDLYGIVNEQLYDRIFIQDRLHHNLNPRQYVRYGDSKKDVFMRIWSAIVLNKPDKKDQAQKNDFGPDYDLHRYDYYNLYMSMPQQNNTLGIGRYIPKEGETNGKRLPAKDTQVIYKDNLLTEELSKYWAVFAKYLMDKKNHRETGFYHRDMGHFRMCVNQDEKGRWYICYHDSWNLEKGDLKLDFGKPFEIYDRIYFDPEKIEAEYQKQRELMTYEDRIMSLDSAERTVLEDNDNIQRKYDICDETTETIDKNTGLRTMEFKVIYGENKGGTEIFINKIGNVQTESKIVMNAKGEIINGFGPAYEEAKKKQDEEDAKKKAEEQQETEPKTVEVDRAARHQRQSENKEGVDEIFKSLSNNGKGWKAEDESIESTQQEVVLNEQAKQVHGRDSMKRTEDKPFYGHHKGGIDDTIVKLDAQEREKVSSHSKKAKA